MRYKLFYLLALYAEYQFDKDLGAGYMPKSSKNLAHVNKALLLLIYSLFAPQR